MVFDEISGLRLINQHLFHPRLKSVKDLVETMGALQAQDFNMSRWAVGVRVSSATNKIIEKAFNNAEIIRTHLLRPTWHIVSSKDIYWLLELTAPQIKASLRSRHKGLEITQQVIKKSRKIIENCLRGENHLTREELISNLENSKIKTRNNRASHIFLMLELDGLICSGIIKGKKQTYALLEERVPAKKILYRDEALAELAKKYFTSHGPATLYDFAWWSGLSMRDSGHALEMVKENFISASVNSKTYWFKDEFNFNKKMNNDIFLLPAYDEFIISYKDRSAVIAQENFSKAVSNNGMFRPVIVYKGNVIGLWKSIREKDNILIEATLFKSHSKLVDRLIKKTSFLFEDFWGKPVEVTFTSF
jgi:hypothetical protein